MLTLVEGLEEDLSSLWSKHLSTKPGLEGWWG